MEATEKLPAEDRFVRIYIGVKNEKHLYMSFTNLAGKKKEMIGGKFLSTKGENHGMGLGRAQAQYYTEKTA